MDHNQAKVELEKREIVKQAIIDNKILPSSAVNWLKQLDSDLQGTKDLLNGLEPKTGYNSKEEEEAFATFLIQTKGTKNIANRFK